ncbi:DUF1768-domain-containing protein [Lophiostoma macrostomum CBS 122681]|uniref:DUF1768-domain-containing protein n=1 Tax=Lophiostoma macrostomum CBS 122681 TaxID=1314788 RepID=A0A6A6TQC1_9PLEO|nr:DUF1768-domain-containing protein [Lophiostoma macrostomum CBS 122681]
MPPKPGLIKIKGTKTRTKTSLDTHRVAERRLVSTSTSPSRSTPHPHLHSHPQSPSTSTSSISISISPQPNMSQPTPTPTNSSLPTPTSTPIYFWKPHEKNGYLGQWYTSPFSISGSTYRTAEMYMMVQKAALFGDSKIAAQMLKTQDPKTHKALGRKVRGFDEGVWESNRLRIVTEGTYHKFTTATNAAQLRTMLLATGDRELVEASPLDRIWGIGFAESNAGANREYWGLNLLGRALMDVRTRLREEERAEREERARKVAALSQKGPEVGDGDGDER